MSKLRKVTAPARARLAAVRSDADVVRRALTRAMRRPSTYPGFVKEVVWAGMHVALYPAGVVSDALKVEPIATFGERWSREIPLHYLEPEAASTPIVLLHGAFHNRSAFMLMRRSLKRHGFRYVDTMNYNVIGHDIPELAERLGEHVTEVLDRVGATQVHIIGHSLGGLVTRYYVQELGGDDNVHTAITLGSPHQGTYAAYVGAGRAAKQLRPGSPLIKQLSASARPMRTRWISFYSNLDSMIIPAGNAKIVEPELRPVNILVKDQGHLSLLVSRPLIHAVGDLLSSLDDQVAVDVLAAQLRRAAGKAEARDARA